MKSLIVTVRRTENVLPLREQRPYWKNARIPDDGHAAVRNRAF